MLINLLHVGRITSTILQLKKPFTTNTERIMIQPILPQNSNLLKQRQLILSYHHRQAPCWLLRLTGRRRSIETSLRTISLWSYAPAFKSGLISVIITIYTLKNTQYFPVFQSLVQCIAYSGV